MPFGFFKKKNKEDEEPSYDPTNITIRDLRLGYIFDFEMKTFEVTGEYEYDWGDNDRSYEYKIESATDTFFLQVDDEDELTGTVNQSILWGKLPENVEEDILKKGKPPKSISFNGKEFFRDEKSVGYWRDVHSMSSDESTEYMCWDYYDESEKFVLCIEQHGDEAFNASLGIVEPARKFTNILPNSKG
ncbi:DUF4178 domain-containing protein [Flammeovirga pacifica]|uniref:DUF4178 domain-containing protein n=1 Tax=Flammeovirga pacifica TaxID=915059 RepID=A0A1S1YYS5_FLAPC|nr:DUF4178 domain-containing protein [Flammeovirga pacifica]OHX66083.1 hypothetical protein NH26_06835 [Flammeovirga pacifica]